MTRLRIGTRGSVLARWQANWVADRLVERGVEVELVPIATRGDAAQHEPITAATEPGIFTKELQRALLEACIDLAVHSLKDLPTIAIDGLALAAVPAREDPRDVLVSRAGSLAELPGGAIVGTGSFRRRAQLLHARGDLVLRDIRGNVDTRLAKLAAGEYQAIVLAHAGLKRLGLEGCVTQTFEPLTMLPAAGQGALGIEARVDDQATRQCLAMLDHAATHLAVAAERSVLSALGAGCSAPVGAWAEVQGDGSLRLEAVVLSLDGTKRLAATASSPVAEAEALGARVASELLAAGAAALIEQARGG
jgi:hydroxymethylbilane synthase